MTCNCTSEYLFLRNDNYVHTKPTDKCCYNIDSNIQTKPGGLSLQSVRPSRETPEYDTVGDCISIGCFIVICWSFLLFFVLFHARDPTKGFHRLENEPLRYIQSPLFFETRSYSTAQAGLQCKTLLPPLSKCYIPGMDHHIQCCKYA